MFFSKGVNFLVNCRNNLPVTRPFLIIEICVITISVICFTKFLHNTLDGWGTWYIAPFFLVMAAVVPTVLKKRKLADIGFSIERLGFIFRVLGWTCLVVFAFLFCGVVLFRRLRLALPLCPVILEKDWISWLAYQFLYVSVAEEIFFRGYLQSNVLDLLTISLRKNRVFVVSMSIVVSAAVFAVSHSVLWGGMLPLITFFPGLIFGWLFFKTKSLLAPVLLHGLMNAGYGFIAAIVA